MKINGRTLRPRMSNAAYVLPNLLTACNLFWGFYAIIKSLQGEFEGAVYAIFLAAVFDVLDGRVAKLTKTHSSFGIQLDSLCDLVSFGVAPSFLLFQYSLQRMDRIGWITCFIYLACGALRLARFNVSNYQGKSTSDFTGLPIPMAALIISSYVIFVAEMKKSASHITFIDQAIKYLTTETAIDYSCLVLALLLSLAMVSNIKWRSHKSLNIKAIKPFNLLVLAIIILGIIAYRPAVWAFIIGIGYGLSGLVEWLFGWKKLATDDDIFPNEGDENDS